MNLLLLTGQDTWPDAGLPAGIKKDCG